MGPWAWSADFGGGTGPRPMDHFGGRGQLQRLSGLRDANISPARLA
jgi:hypothetical protein